MKLVTLVILSIISIEIGKSQDLNAIEGSGFNIATSFTPVNAPESTVILGVQDQYDTNYKWQFVHAYNSDNYYLRRYQYSWKDYLKIWHSGNLNRADVDFSAQTLNSSSLKITALASANLIEAMTIDVNSFGTSENVNNSYFFRVRDIGANAT
jgi:hypothetical protein